MKAMILAAGYGERMRPLTDSTPKPLLRVAGIPLIEHHVRALAAAGVHELVINVSHLGQQIVDYLGDGFIWGVNINYTLEPAPLEVAGGIQRALFLLGDPFIVVNGDIWCDYPFVRLRDYRFRSGESAYLVMVDNPPQHPQGDFCLDDEWRLQLRPPDAVGLTYAGIGLYSARFFSGLAPGKQPLRPLLEAAINRQALGGEHYIGEWTDVGTPERLAALREQVEAGSRPG